jgi:biotin carboxyl carrier protein
VIDLRVPAGEHLTVLERVVTAPACGDFRPLPPECVTCEGEVVDEGQIVGYIDHLSDREPVRSPFRGFLMGMLAVDGERVREGQPVAWLRAL